MNWFKRLFGRKSDQDIEIIGEDDPNIQAMVNAVYKSGKPLIGHINEEGKLEVKEPS